MRFLQADSGSPVARLAAVLPAAAVTVGLTGAAAGEPIEYIYVGNSAGENILRFTADGTAAPSEGNSGAVFIDETASADFSFDTPVGVVLGPDFNGGGPDLYFSDAGNGLVGVADGTTGEYLGALDNDMAATPYLLASLGDNVYVADYGADEIDQYAVTTNTYSDGFTSGPPTPYGLAADAENNRIFTTSLGNSEDPRVSVASFNATTGELLEEYSFSSTTVGDDLRGIVYGPDGMVYVADNNNNRIFRFDPDPTDPTAEVLTLEGAEFSIGLPVGLAFANDSDGTMGRDLLVVDNTDNAIYRFNVDDANSQLDYLGTFADSTDGLEGPIGLAYGVIPEPASVALLGLGGALMLGRSRR